MPHVSAQPGAFCFRLFSTQHAEYIHIGSQTSIYASIVLREDNQMNIEQSEMTITLIFSKRHLVISAVLFLTVISLIAAAFVVPRVIALSHSALVSGGGINGTRFGNAAVAQTSDCPNQFTQIAQAFAALAQIITNSNDTTVSGDIITDFSSTYTLQNITTAREINSAGCPAEGEITDQFEPTDRIYLVAENSDVVSGTALFARLYFEGDAIEDTSEMVADRDYNNICVNLWFESAEGFAPGEYTIELFVNGNSTTQVKFEVE
jgi:flagellar basal body-associated protein FliL